MTRTTPTVRPGRAASNAASWWTGGLFAIGSICFALGSTRLYFDHVQPAVVAGRSSSDRCSSPRPPHCSTDRRHRPRASRRQSRGGQQSCQLVGTVFFNITTFAATRTDITLDQERHLIWAPDVFGSICFLVASGLAYSEVNHAVRPHSDGSTGWWIAAVNLAGSVAFGAAAIAARYLHTTGEIANITLVNVGTFVGGLCFLAARVLLPVDATRETPADSP